MAQKKRKKPKQPALFSDWLTGAMLLVIVGIMPLVVRYAERPMPPETTSLFNGRTSYSDVFTLWKRWFLTVPALIIVLGFASDIVTARRRLDLKAILTRPPVIASLVYLFFVLLSFIFSDFRFTAFHGTYERGEGILAQAAYVTVFIACLYYFRSTKYSKLMLYGLVFSSLLMGAVGLSQSLHHDFFHTEFAKLLVTGYMDATMTINFPSAYGTLFNPNTFGMYSAMLAPLLLIIGFVYDGEKWVKTLFMLAGALMLAGVVGSYSSGGIAGIFTAAAVLALTFACRSISNKKKLSQKFVLTAAAILAVLVASCIFVKPVNTNIKYTWYKIAGSDERLAPTDYLFEDGLLTVTDGNGDVLFALGGSEADDWLMLYDKNGKAATQKISLTGEEAYSVKLNVPNADQNYTIRGKGKYFSLNELLLSSQKGRIVPHMRNGAPIDTSTPVASWGFKGREHWGTERGYIWSRTFPLMGKYAVIGSGSDSFINVFPQHDVVGKLRFFGTPYIIVDKAHNLYLQTWITTGGISALALLFLLGYYLVTTFVSLVRTQEKAAFVYGLRLGLLAAISAFAVSSLATDSTIGSTGVFFVLLGLGYAANGWQTES